MASGYHSSIQLFTEDESVYSDKYYNDVGNIESSGFSYTKYKVTKEAGDGAVWLVYSEPNYASAGGGVGESKYVLPDPVSMVPVKAGFAIKSIQAFNITQPCICLFENFRYMGNKMATEQSVNDITGSFPPGEVPGMSSAIATSGLWSVYTEPAFNGPHQDVDALSGTQVQSSFDRLNDKVKSIKLVRASTQANVCQEQK